jgi:metal-sulfur cluster biosynthetic enzyme
MALEPYVVCALQEVFDPEVGVNIVDLGLVYGVTDQDGHVRVQMTMTHRGGPLTRYITGMAEATIRQTVAGVKSVKIDLVWEPPWSPKMAADHARQRLLAI